MDDYGHAETSKRLKKLERRIDKEYSQAAREMQEKLDDYMRRFRVKDEIKRKALKSGKITKEEYDRWRTGQIMMGKRWEEMRDTLAQDLENTNKIAASMTRQFSYEAYALNHNYGTFEVEKGSLVDTSYTLYDKSTVERLVRNNPDMLPPPGKKVSEEIRRGEAKLWNKQKIQSVMTQGILQGESIPRIAKRLAEAVEDSNRASAIRNARTMTTGAENAGRVDSYKRAKSMGIDMEQMWVAVMDSSTRHSHRVLDGETIKVGDQWHHTYFSNGCRFPGDPSGPPREVYNCRCTLIAKLAEVDFSSSYLANRRNPELGGMTYEEWKKGHAVAKPVVSTPPIMPKPPVVVSHKKDYISEILTSPTTKSMTDAQKAEFNQVLDNMSEEHLDMYRKMTPFHGDSNYVNGPGWYDPAKGKVEMTLNANGWERSMGKNETCAWKTKFHEELHQLDHILGVTEGNGRYSAITKYERDYWGSPTGIGTRLGNAIKDDITDFINNGIDYYNNEYGTSVKHISDINSPISRPVKDAFFEYLDLLGGSDSKFKASVSAFTDAVGLTTRARIDPYSNGWWGHKPSYSKDRGINGATSECFAEIGSHIMRNDKESLDALELVMPKSIKEYRSVIHELGEMMKTKPIHY